MPDKNVIGKLGLLITVLLLVLQAFSISYAQDEKTIELSLSDCLNIGLVNNLDIKIAKIEAKVKAEDVQLSKSIFDTIIDGEVTYEDDRRVNNSASILGTKTLTTEYKAGVTKKIPTGTELSMDYIDTRIWTNRTLTTVNPAHEAELSFSLRQPVLRNFFGYVDRREVLFSKIEAELADIKALDRIENTIADIGKAYWQLVFEYQNVVLQKDLLDQAEKLYKIFEAHLTTGFAEETEVYETEANMRTRKANLLISQNRLVTASNILLLLLNEDKYFLISPRDKLKTLWGKADLAKSLKEAFIANRDYRMRKKELEAKKVTLKMKENSLWPEVDLVGTFAMNGIDRKFWKAQKPLGTTNSPYYYGGVEFSVPLENREARSEYNKASLQKEKVILEILQVEKEIFTEVDEEVRSVNINFENAKRFTKIKEIQYAKFKEEEKKLRYGRSKSKIVVDYQEDLTRAALREYTAILDYYISLIDLENAKDTLLRSIGVLG